MRAAFARMGRALASSRTPGETVTSTPPFGSNARSVATGIVRQSYNRTPSASAVAIHRPVGSIRTACTGAGVRTKVGRVNPQRGGPGRPGCPPNGNGCHTHNPLPTATTKWRPSAEAAAARGRS